MDKSFFEELKGKTREERAEMLKNNKDVALCLDELGAVNGGNNERANMNPNSSECPYLGNWVSSFGYICRGEVVC